METIKALTLVYALSFTVGAAFAAGWMFMEKASERFVDGWNGPETV